MLTSALKHLQAGKIFSTEKKLHGANAVAVVVYIVGVDYVVMDGLTLNTDVRYISETKYSKNGIKVDGKDDAVSFLVGVSKGFSNGSLGVGFEGITNGIGFSEIPAGKDDKGKVHDGFMWCVPVVLTFSF